jgi:chromate reductase, NAD(P)H dehydrogenase (quinone)
LPEVQIAALNGSLGVASANGAALAVAVDRLGESAVEVSVVGDLQQIPAFSADAADTPPSSVMALADTLRRCDAVMIAAPEYAAGLSGALKNALDWQVGLSSLYRRPVGVLSAGTTGGPYAIEQLVRTLSWQGAMVVATLGIAAPKTKMSGSRFSDRATFDAIRAWADEVVNGARADAARRLAMVTAVVGTCGIDPARLGDQPS